MASRGNINKGVELIIDAIDHKMFNSIQYREGGIMAPYRFLLCCIKTVCSKKKEGETFRLLASTYWASENVIVNDLLLDLLPWQPYC